MPVEQKKNKSSEEAVDKYNAGEIKGNFVPVDEGDVARAIEVPVRKKVSEEIIEKKAIKRVRKKSSGKTRKKSSGKTRKKSSGKTKSKTWVEEFKIPGNKKLKEKGIILIITEKPQAAQKISEALAEGKIVKRNLNGVSYYDLERGGKQISIVSAVGHLFSVAQVHPRNKWPTFDIAWAPNYLVRKKDFTKKYYSIISKMCKNASEIVVATDYDIEGEVIGMNIVRYICNQKDAKRMKFSTLTAKEIQNAYDNKSNTLDWNQGIAGETRHYLDWIYGINLSRALMNSIKETGNFRLMSIGRVQGPALNIIVKKEKEIGKFVPEKYWQIFLEVSDGKNKLEVKHNKDITEKKELEKFNQMEGKQGDAATTKSQRKLEPLAPFDLTALQTEAYRLYKITPTKTLQIAQKLYLSGIISYPRTSSQQIPKEIGYEKIIERLKNNFDFVKFINRKEPIEGKKKDPAHPSIYPTGEFHEVEGDDKKIYELIVKRFISCFCEDALIDDKKVGVLVDNLKFSAKGVSILNKGWMNVYPKEIEESEIPDLNGKVDILKVKIEEKLTQPPKRYTPASIISELEKKNLGTKATRASILETLNTRGYVRDKSLSATSLGMSLINTLEENCPIIIDEKLTRNIETDLEQLRQSKKPIEKEKEILEETRKVMEKIGEHFDRNKMKIGKDLIEATTKLWEQERKDAELCECPICKKGKLAIKYNKVSRRYFIACNNYPECKTTYSLPPNAFIKKADKQCVECGFPMLMSIKKGKRPWIFCFNPECITRQKKDEKSEKDED